MTIIKSSSSKLAISLLVATTLNYYGGIASAFVPTTTTTKPLVTKAPSIPSNKVSSYSATRTTTHLSISSTIDQATSTQDEDPRSTAIDKFLNGPKPTRGGGQWVSSLTVEETSEFAGRSFAGTEEIAGEPMIGWLFDKVKFGSHKEKADLIKFLVSFFVMEGIARKSMIFAKKLPNNALSAMTLIRTYDPNAQESLVSKMIMKFRKLVHFAKILLTGRLPAFLQGKTDYHKQVQKEIDETSKPLYGNMAKWHKQHGPKSKHWYIGVVASNPDYQGQGQGSELMRRVMELADEAQMDCYLEAGNEKNRMFYEKFGFAVAAEKEMTTTLNDTPHTLYLMVRPHN